MWFAALGNCEANPWFIRLQQRLLEGSPGVRALFAETPGPQRTLIRSPVSSYAFAQPDSASGVWWEVHPAGHYCPPLTLHEGRITPAVRIGP